MSLKICVAQLNLVVGDLPGNARQIIDAAHTAHAQGARLLLTPELAISGYIAEDLFLRPAFIAACDDALNRVARETAGLGGLTIVVGHPSAVAPVDDVGPRCANAASVLCEGRRVAHYAKRLLPNYEVFDERRYFTPGQGSCVFTVDGVRVGLLICEDAWFDEPAAATRQAGAELLAVINASPYHQGKGAEREAAMARRARASGLPLVYANLVGGQDEVVFDGRSLAIGAEGLLAGRAASFKENLFFVQASRAAAAIELKADMAPEPTPEAELWEALVLGLRDYVDKNGFAGVALGLSGGLDSALVLALAGDALGAARVRTLMMPSPYTAGMSVEDAHEMARRLGVRHDELSIRPAFETLRATLAPLFAGRGEDVTEENIQARVRGVLLMALSNKLGHLILTTGNKSEYAVGYCTLYGDMCGGFAPIKDVAKTTAYRLARWRNAHDPHGTGANPMPERIITRAPRAELREGQTDQDSLPPYEVLDAIVARYVEDNASIADLLAEGFAAADVERVTRLIKASEYKRQQAAVGTRVTRRSFGKDWRYPMTNRYRV